MSWRSQLEETFEHNDLVRVQVTIKLTDGLSENDMLDFEAEVEQEISDGGAYESCSAELDRDRHSLNVVIETFVPQVDYEELSDEAAHDAFYGVGDRIGDEVAALVKGDEAVAGVSSRVL